MLGYITMRGKISWWLACCLLGVAQFFFGQVVLATNALAPDAAAKNFYVWYLQELTADRDPWRNDKVKLSEYVAKPLLKEIERKMHSPDGLGTDYFLQAQDYLDDWSTNISIHLEDQNSRTASLNADLGNSKNTLQRLRVVMTREDGVWKLRRVQLRSSSEP